MLSCRHSGFNGKRGPLIQAGDEEEMENIARQIIQLFIFPERKIYVQHESRVICWSRDKYNGKAVDTRECLAIMFS